MLVLWGDMDWVQICTDFLLPCKALTTYTAYIYKSLSKTLWMSSLQTLEILNGCQQDRTFKSHFSDPCVQFHSNSNEGLMPRWLLAQCLFDLISLQSTEPAKTVSRAACYGTLLNKKNNKKIQLSRLHLRICQLHLYNIDMSVTYRL